MRKFLGLVLLISVNLIAQTKGVVKDSLTGNPISYVSIWVENENIGTTSEENGEFAITISDKNKNLIFSALGFESKIVSIDNSKNVILRPKVLDLDEVIITNRKGKDEVVIGDYAGIDLNAGFVSSGKEDVYHIIGKVIKFNKVIEKHPFVKSIEFHTKSDLNNVLLRLRFFSLDEEGNPSGKNIVEKEILVPIAKGKRKNVVDLTAYQISIPKCGMIVGFENLHLQQNLKKFRHSIQGQKGSHKTQKYEPSILGFYNDHAYSLDLNQDGSLHFPVNTIELALKLTLTN